MNEVLKNMIERRGIRKYKETRVPRELIEEIVKCGLCAPSGMNRQPVKIIAITRKDLRDRLSRMNCKIGGWKEGFDPFYGAPAILVVLAGKESPTCLYDGSVAMENMLLAAHALGLGSCWVHRAKEEFESPEGKKILGELGIEGDLEGIGHCIVGYPDQEPPMPERKEGRVFFVD